MAKRRARPMDKKLTTPTRPARERPQPLPGMEHRNIRALEDLAHQYAEKRDARMEVGREEKALKVSIITLMHKHQKTHYAHNGLEITLLPKDEDVKVKVKGAEADDAEPDEDEDDDDDDTDDENNGVWTEEEQDPPVGDPPSTRSPITDSPGDGPGDA